MNNLSTATGTSTSADISSLIGALELSDHMDSHSDGALLRAAEIAMLQPPPTQPRPLGRCASDNALEESGMRLTNPVPTTPLYRNCAMDGALQAAGGNHHPLGHNS